MTTVQNQYIEPSPPPDGLAPDVLIMDIDCLRLAEQLYQDTGQPSCVLNMANQFNVGGDHQDGNGQEETIIRRTNLLQSLAALEGVVEGNLSNPQQYKLENTLGFNNDEQQTGFGEFTCLYSPDITVQTLYDPFTDEKNDEKSEDTEPFPVNILSSAAYNLTDENIRPENPYYIAGTVFKILNQLRTAKLHNQRTLILGAFGCGAFQNNAGLIAEIYRSALHEYEFRGCFDHVYFAIKSPSSYQKTRVTFIEEFSSPFLPKLIRDLLITNVPADLVEKNAQLKAMMAPYFMINSAEELHFLAERKINAELVKLKGNKRAAGKRDFLIQLLNSMANDPDDVINIINTGVKSAEFEALTPTKGMFTKAKYYIGTLLLELVSRADFMKHNMVSNL